MSTEKTPLEYAAQRVLPEYVDVNYHLEILNTFPEGEWFQPTNKNQECYSICSLLEDFGLIECKRQPMWHDGSRRGCKVFFRYKHDLIF